METMKKQDIRRLLDVIGFLKYYGFTLSDGKITDVSDNVIEGLTPDQIIAFHAMIRDLHDRVVAKATTYTKEALDNIQMI